MTGLEEWGALAFGTIIGWFVYFTNRYRTGDVGFSDITALLGAIGGGAITALFEEKGRLFAAYGIGLAIGFFAYFIVLMVLVRISKNFDTDWFLDGRRKEPSGDYSIPGGIRPNVTTMSVQPPEVIENGGFKYNAALSAIQIPVEILPVMAPLPASFSAQATEFRTTGNDLVLESCKAVWSANQKDCNKFVKAVSKRHGVTFTGNADAILGSVKGAGWRKEKDGAAAAAAAKSGRLVIAGMTAKELGDSNGHVVVVVDGPLAFDKYPTSYWGSINEKIRKDGGLGKGLNYAFSSAKRDKVYYASIAI